MADRDPRPAGADLDAELRALAADLEYPVTPDIAAGVSVRLRAAPRQVARRRWWPGPAWRGLAIAAGSALALGLVILGLSPRARDAAAHRLGLRGVRIEYGSPTPVPSPSTPTASPLAAGDRLGLGEGVTIEDAQARAPFRVLQPSLADIGPPDEVYFGAQPPGGQVALVYGAGSALPATKELGVGMLLTEFRGRLDPAFIKKIIGPGTRIEGVVVAGAQGYWIEGDAHEFIYLDADGNIRPERVRLAGNVLLWERDGVTYRLEAALDRDRAMRIAESLR